jgi:hypothetical protein
MAGVLSGGGWMMDAVTDPQELIDLVIRFGEAMREIDNGDHVSGPRSAAHADRLFSEIKQRLGLPPTTSELWGDHWRPAPERAEDG